MQNIELKVKVDSIDPIKRALEICGATHEGLLVQKDTYFNTQKGRLKLREINQERTELIYYERPDTKESKSSRYQITSIPYGESVEFITSLDAAIGVRVIVLKERSLFIYKHTRVHLDSVDSLGIFLELETVVGGISEGEAKQEHDEVKKLLELEQYEKIDVSYSDLLLQKKRRHNK